eukprot:scaffold268527_cov36-Tisochrysis_lutea.AAC.4
MCTTNRRRAPLLVPYSTYGVHTATTHATRENTTTSYSAYDSYRYTTHGHAMRCLRQRGGRMSESHGFIVRSLPSAQVMDEAEASHDCEVDCEEA